MIYKPNARQENATLRLNETTTKASGFTTLIRTGTELDQALGFAEDGLSFGYYGALDSDNAGASSKADSYKDAADYLRLAADILEQIAKEQE